MELWKRNLYILWFTQILSLSGFGFGLPFIPFYMQELGVTDPEQLQLLVGINAALPAVLMGIMALVWGRLSDQFGRKPMVLRALFSGFLIIGGMGLAQNVETILVLRAAQGLLTGTMTAATTLVAAGTPRKRLAFALGFISSSNFIGFSFGPFLGGFAAEFFGYRTSFFIGGSILLVAFVLVLFFIKEPSRDAEEIDEKGAIGGDTNEGRNGGEEEFSLKNIFRGSLLLILLLVFLMRFIRSFAQPFFPLYVQEILGRLEGASMNTGIITGLAGLATALAGITLGRLGDKFDKMRLISIYLILGAMVALPLFYTRSLIFFAVFLIATRYFLGGVEPLLLSVLGVNTPPEKRGIVFGIQTFAGSMGWFFAPMVGSSISIGLGIRYVFLFHCLGIAFAFLVIFLFRQGNAIKRAMKRLRAWR